MERVVERVSGLVAKYLRQWSLIIDEYPRRKWIFEVDEKIHYSYTC